MNLLDDLKISITKINNSYIHIETTDDIALELNNQFSFFAENYKFHPKFKARMWNGKIYLFSLKTRNIYAGLLPDVVRFAADRGYEIKMTSEVKTMFFDESEDKESFLSFIQSFPIAREGQPLEYRPAQMYAIYKGITSKRLVMLAATGVGKSLIIYGLMRYLQDTVPGKILLVVPNMGLVEQMHSDFDDYSYLDEDWDVRDNAARLYSEYDYDSGKQILISTWQTLQHWENDVFEQFDAVIVDETHGAKGAEIRRILELSTQAEYRFGLTGTLDGKEVNELVIKGLIGPIIKIQSAKEAMDDGTLVPLNINCVELKYPSEVAMLFKKKKFKYHDEVEFLCGYQPRNDFLTKLATNLEGNTLVLFTLVEKHGKILYNQIKEATDRPVYLIYGGVDAQEREQIRQILKTEKNAIVVASYATLSTGVNIPSIENIVFASSSKSLIRILQSIGRGLRNNEGKVECKLYDVVDNINDKNYSYTHFVERMKIYSQQHFQFKVTEVNIDAN